MATDFEQIMQRRKASPSSSATPKSTQAKPSLGSDFEQIMQRRKGGVIAPQVKAPEPYKSTSGEAFVREAALGIGPAAAGVAAIPVGAAIGATLGPIGSFGGAIISSLSAAYAASKAQDIVLPKIFGKENMDVVQQKRAISADTNPVASTLGQLSTSLPFFRPSLQSLKDLKKLPGALRDPAQRNTIAGRGAVDNAINVGAGGAIQGSMNAYEQNQDETPFNWTELAVNIAGGGLLNTPTNLGNRIGLKTPDYSPEPVPEPQPQPLPTPTRQLRVRSATPEALPVETSTPNKRQAAYAKKQGYEAFTPDDELPTIQMGTKPPTLGADANRISPPKVFSQAEPAGEVKPPVAQKPTPAKAAIAKGLTENESPKRVGVRNTTPNRKTDELLESYARSEEQIKKVEELQSVINAKEDPKKFAELSKSIEKYEVGNRSVIKQLATHHNLTDFEIIDLVSTYIGAGKKRGGRTLTDFYKFLPKEEVVETPTKRVMPIDKLSKPREVEPENDFRYIPDTPKPTPKPAPLKAKTADTKPTRVPMKLGSEVRTVKVETKGTAIKAKATPAKSVTVPKEQLPSGTGDERISRYAARMKAGTAKILPEDKDAFIEKYDLPTFNRMNQKTEMENAVKYVLEDEADALARFISGRDAPDGTHSIALGLALQEKATATGDSDLAISLASLKATRAGQDIALLRQSDPDDPFRAMGAIVDARRDQVARNLPARHSKGKTNDQAIASAVKEETDALNKELDLTEIKLEDVKLLLDELDC